MLNTLDGPGWNPFHTRATFTPGRGWHLGAGIETPDMPLETIARRA